MLKVSYNTGCRQCLNSDGIRSMYLVDGGNVEEYLKKTEFEAMQKVEAWRKEDGHVCQYCGSPNVEITNVQADDEPIYDYQRLVNRVIKSKGEMFMLNVDKRESRLSLNEGGKDNPDIRFLEKCFRLLIEKLSLTLDGKFVSHINGNFFVCFTGNFNDMEGNYEIDIERFRFHGVSKDDVITGINKTLHKYGIAHLLIDAKWEKGVTEELELNLVWVSSDHIRYQNGIKVSGPYGHAPRALKVEPNIDDDEGFIVTMFNIDGGQAVLQMAPKQMKVTSIDSKKYVLRGYGYDVHGESFSDYGISIFHKEGEIEKMILHLHDRNVDIEYLP